VGKIFYIKWNHNVQQIYNSQTYERKGKQVITIKEEINKDLAEYPP